MPPKRKTNPNTNTELILPIKQDDGEALLRAHLEADLLAWIFSNSEYRFTPPPYPNETTPLFPMDRTWTFAELYLDCVANSTKAPKALREKMAESQDFAVAFAKVCLLVNLNKLNTTHAFFLECRTLNRTFHSLPSLQLNEHTRKNLPDAPRLKAQLKGCLLPQEKAGAAEKLQSIAEVARTKTPPTTVVNLIFALINEASWVSAKYLAPGQTLSDILGNKDFSSQQRSEAFLFILHRFLQDPDVGDDWTTPGRIGDIVLVPVNTAHENQDTPEELEYAEQIKQQRQDFVSQLRAGLPHTESLHPDYIDASKATRSNTIFRESSPAIDRGVPGSDPSVAPDAYDLQYPGRGNSGTIRLEDLGQLALTEDEIRWYQYIDAQTPAQTPRAEHEGSHADAFDRAKHERYNDIDPLYDSEDEDTPESKNSFTLAELRQRVNVFTVPPEPNDHGDQKPKLVRYDGRVIRPAVLRPVEPLPPGIGGTDAQASESNAPSPSSEHED